MYLLTDGTTISQPTMSQLVIFFPSFEFWGLFYDINSIAAITIIDKKSLTAI